MGLQNQRNEGKTAGKLDESRIWLAILASYTHDYPEESIRQILTNLMAMGPEGERKAKEVVDAYLGHGIERPRMWLMEIKKQGANV